MFQKAAHGGWGAAEQAFQSGVSGGKGPCSGCQKVARHDVYGTFGRTAFQGFGAHVGIAEDFVGDGFAEDLTGNQGKIAAVALAGRLRMPQARALQLFHAATTGVTLLFLRQAPEQRDMTLSHQARDAAIAALTGASEAGVATGAAGAALALQARLPEIAGLTRGERLMLAELLERSAEAG